MEWQTGGAPAYGDGVAFAAVGEMVRRRCRIAENARSRGRAASARFGARSSCSGTPTTAHGSSPDWRSSSIPAPRARFEREELFAAWRRFFERLAEDAPTVLVFEDLQWADAGLLDFIEHLGTWTRDRPILVLTLARPELLDARPGVGRRPALVHGPAPRPACPTRAMRELLEGRANGIPAAALRHILDRAGGVPLYAVELTRMLLDRGRLVPVNGAYRLAGTLADADLPDSLMGLLAARLDALPAARPRRGPVPRRCSADASRPRRWAR